jgi:Uma2 family endonuclease
MDFPALMHRARISIHAVSIAQRQDPRDNPSMATQPIAEPLISVREYLSTVYQPDCEYNEGLIEERNLGEFDHSFLQAVLVTLFTNQIAAWGVFALPEQRVQMKPKRYVVPDLTVLRMGTPREPILTRPPLITIEIKSPEDKFKNITSKSQEYLDFGVEHVWIVDPKDRAAYRAVRHEKQTNLELVPSGELTVPGTPILVRVGELFDKLDQF